MNGRFEGRTAVVTGGANGIGRATVRRFVAEGARVGVLDREVFEPDDDREAAAVVAHAGDGTDAATLERFFADVEARFGAVDVLFNNLGQSGRERAGLFVDSEEEVWRFVLEINLVATLRATRIVAPKMVARGWGRIVNMASEAALAGDPRLADYAAAKMGIIGFTRVLAHELAPHGITANVVCPGAVRTRAHALIPPETLAELVASTPVGFIADPEDVAGLVAYLASAEARFVTGQTIAINGGRTLL